MKFGTTIVALLLLCGLAVADQNDPKLDILFQELVKTDEAEEGELITREIWQVWYDIGDVEAQDLMDRGVAFMEEPDFRSALIAFTKLTKIRPKFAEGWNKRATLFYLMGEYKLSLLDIQRTLLLEPRHFGAISGLGQIYVRQNRLGEARKAFEKALEINPHLSGARINVERISQWLNDSSI